jgi:hypothetical protein
VATTRSFGDVVAASCARAASGTYLIGGGAGCTASTSSCAPAGRASEAARSETAATNRTPAGRGGDGRRERRCGIDIPILEKGREG